MKGTKLRLQFASDLHLEFEPKRTEFDDVLTLVEGCDTLVLNGDIGTTASKDVLRLFLTYCKKLWKEVFFIAGNHEYYHSSYDRANKELAQLCKECDVVWVLDHVHTWEEPSKWALVMAPLWSYIPPDLEDFVASQMNDYNLVEGGFTPAFTSELHTTMLENLTNHVNRLRLAGYKCVVATHHTPLVQGTSAPAYEGSNLNCAFSTDCHTLMRLGVSWWIYGHTHYNARGLQFVHNEDHGTSATRIVSNQRGYHGRLDKESDSYSPTRFIELDDD